MDEVGVGTIAQIRVAVAKCAAQAGDVWRAGLRKLVDRHGRIAGFRNGHGNADFDRRRLSKASLTVH
jgi:hypothetical protein